MTAGRGRLAIVGAGSSGLISLKHALDALPEWEIECFEESDTVTGAWGRPYDGFVSTSTKYTTQFSCLPVYDASVQPDRGESRSEFFRDGEYGEYLNRFAEHFDLRRHIKFRRRVLSVRRPQDATGWEVTFQSDPAAETQTSRFDAVILCTGLVAEPRSSGDHPHAIDPRTLFSHERTASITGKAVAVIGGGEMAADFANRFARPELGNRVLLSLRSGVRVSPRYHPIRGVPSDFLRNRLMLSIHEDIRNRIGNWFVRTRIRRQEWLEWLFPDAKSAGAAHDTQAYARRKQWGEILNRRAQHNLFDMFHNKSDDFLTAVAEDRLRIVGPPVDSSLTKWEGFDDDGPHHFTPDVVVPAIGFRSRLGEVLGGGASVRDFYLGCRHAEHDDLFLVGFARPVIGNIPSISEIQARYVSSVIAGRTPRPDNLTELHRADVEARTARYRGVDTRLIYPVEMFPYCDRLAAAMGESPRAASLVDWWTQNTAPATTLDYHCFGEQRGARPRPPTYMPTVLIALLLALKPVDWTYRLLLACR
ncbi:Flavin-binding monooxygenase-like protein [Posidoniimonas polymericola]|uniref:Flavin-binding monooxygenase-like protein n=1 Tax=Posidoniimonas polymericola TaxID=2528002 RepID=A0A5C5YHX9_9BACT|nr:SidA/IucD/PvdA family monooxygenase [Posidoniimonas polymericola]TWT73632.1 Flavin-binding monooxygenase-like protein [Posidoniimonas polymericola]